MRKAMLSLGLLLLLPATAQAIPIHKHVTVTRHRTSEFAAIHSPRAADYRVQVEKVVKYDVAPPYVPPTPVAQPVSEPLAPTPAPTTVAPAPASSGCTGMEAESGTAGYSAYNPSSGATGCYQIIPSTAANYGCDLSSPAGQDACKNEICAEQGNAAWASSGAAPCG